MGRDATDSTWRPGRALATAAALLGLVAVAGWPAAAQEPAPQATELAEARQVIDRYVEAIGGAELLRSFTSRRATGRFEIPGQGLAGDVEILAAAPDRLLVTITFPGVGVTRTGYDGEVGWSMDPITGPRVLEGAELQQLRADADFYADLHPPDSYRTMETIERTDIQGHTAWKVRLVRDSGRETFEYFDVDSGLMVASEGPQETMMGTLQVTSVLSEYREFDGILIATHLEQDLGMGTRAVTVIEMVEHGEIEASAFDLPAEIRVLVGEAGGAYEAAGISAWREGSPAPR